MCVFKEEALLKSSNYDKNVVLNTNGFEPSNDVFAVASEHQKALTSSNEQI